MADFLIHYGWAALLTAVAGYLLGSVSFSIIFTKAFAKKDIRDCGSGNAGATNVLRSVGARAALLTFVCDFAKCVAAVLIGSAIFGALAAAEPGQAANLTAKYGAYIGGTGCLFGHLYPVYFHFKGGKGVTTTAAMMVLFDWRVFLIEFALFLILFAWKRIVSLGSIAAGAVYPFVTFAVTFFLDYQGVGGYPLSYVIIATVVTAIVGFTVVCKHKENIKRLRAGTEKQIHFRKKPKD